MTDTLLTASKHTLGVARTLAAELAENPGPATALLEKHLRERLGSDCALRLHVTGPDPHPGTRKLTDEEKVRLGAPGIARCCYRTGMLLYVLNGRPEVAAVTTLTWLPARLTSEACIDLAHRMAAGDALMPVERSDRRALALTEREQTGDDDLDIAVKASAVLVTGNWKAAIATENIPRSFTELLAG